MAAGRKNKPYTPLQRARKSVIQALRRGGNACDNYHEFEMVDFIRRWPNLSEHDAHDLVTLVRSWRDADEEE